LEVVRRSPTVLVDAAHNPAGAAVLAEAVHEAFSFTRLVGVIGVLADKDAVGILEALEPVLDDVVITRSSSPRSIPPDELAAAAVDVFSAERVQVAERMDDAIEAAVALAEADGGTGGGVLATGSVTVAADVRALLGAR
jgi:dihydrofolate synthase/folylpolyglutamate synthase